MSTGTKQKELPQQAATNGPSEATLAKAVTYMPFAESKEITLTVGAVRSFISAKTKRGAVASEVDLVKFMMLCQARQLNPWVGDAYLVGYDSEDGPTFSLITAIQSLYKRAEANPNYDGIESGVIVQAKDGTITERAGDLVLSGEALIGGWAKVYRKDRRVPDFDALNLATYDKGFGQWKKDKSGMIVKCAEASALRKAFPSQLSNLFVEQERGLIESGGEIPVAAARLAAPKTLPELAASRQIQGTVEVVEAEPVKLVDPLEGYRTALLGATTESAARDAYEQWGNPEKSGWGPDEDKAASKLLAERIKEIQGAKA